MSRLFWYDCTFLLFWVYVFIQALLAIVRTIDLLMWYMGY